MNSTQTKEIFEAISKAMLLKDVLLPTGVSAQIKSENNSGILAKLDNFVPPENCMVLPQSINCELEQQEKLFQQLKEVDSKLDQQYRKLDQRQQEIQNKIESMEKQSRFLAERTKKLLKQLQQSFLAGVATTEKLLSAQEDFKIPPSYTYSYINIACSCSTLFGEKLLLVGSHSKLGCWNPAFAIEMSTDGSIYPLWAASVNITEPFEFKFVKKTENGFVWEQVGNRHYKNGLFVNCEWNFV